jgi:hypothetical protein
MTLYSDNLLLLSSLRIFIMIILLDIERNCCHKKCVTSPLTDNIHNIFISHYPLANLIIYHLFYQHYHLVFWD